MGLVEGRKGQPGDKRVPLVRVGKVLRLYWEAHFHEKLSQEHAIKLSKNPCRRRGWWREASTGGGQSGGLTGDAEKSLRGGPIACDRTHRSRKTSGTTA